MLQQHVFDFTPTGPESKLCSFVPTTFYEEVGLEITWKENDIPTFKIGDMVFDPDQIISWGGIENGLAAIVPFSIKRGEDVLITPIQAYTEWSRANEGFDKMYNVHNGPAYGKSCRRRRKIFWAEVADAIKNNVPINMVIKAHNHYEDWLSDNCRFAHQSKQLDLLRIFLCFSLAGRAADPQLTTKELRPENLTGAEKAHIIYKLTGEKA